MDNTVRWDEASTDQAGTLPIIVIASSNFGATVTAFAKARPELKETAESAEIALSRLVLRGDFMLTGPQAAGASETELGAKLLSMAGKHQAPFSVELSAADGLI